jgi:hypothetical protein
VDAERLGVELDFLRRSFPDLEYREAGEARWARIPVYPLPDGWLHAGGGVAAVEAVFEIPVQVGQAPYAFYVRPALELPGGAAIGNCTAPAATPWGEDFAKFSWQPETWAPKANVRAGSSMLTFARSFAERLGELS